MSEFLDPLKNPTLVAVPFFALAPERLEAKTHTMTTNPETAAIQSDFNRRTDARQEQLKKDRAAAAEAPVLTDAEVDVFRDRLQRLLRGELHVP
ncbi:MAG: hypothetical protein ACXVXW_14840 [Mycobacteriaceae bacterium]